MTFHGWIARRRGSSVADERGIGRLRRARLIAFALAVALATGAGLDAGIGVTAALFTNVEPAGENTFTAIHIFSGTRTTPAFSVTDASSGAAVDVSAPLAFGGDGRTVTTKAWSTSFAGDRYLEFDLNSPLPAGLGASGVALAMDLAAGAGGETVCFYFEARRASTDSVVATFGTPGSPVACVTGTSLEPSSTSIASAVDSTDVANDLRARVFMSSSGAGTASIDRAVVTGASPYAAFTLYPISSTDAADGTPDVRPWDLAGP